MLKIAVTQRLNANDSYFEIREALDVQWGKLFSEINFLPIILPYDVNFELYFKNFNIDGVFLTGGNDLSFLNPNELSVKRDDFEFKLLEYSLKNKIPVFGVCRGMQLIAKFFGSSFDVVNNQVGNRHKLIACKESEFYSELSNIDEVNSFHNFSVSTVPSSLIVSATDPYGLIKAIEHKEHRVFSQMWHSERACKFSVHELELIKSFFYRNKRQSI